MKSVKSDTVSITTAPASTVTTKPTASISSPLAEALDAAKSLDDNSKADSIKTSSFVSTDCIANNSSSTAAATIVQFDTNSNLNITNHNHTNASGNSRLSSTNADLNRANSLSCISRTDHSSNILTSSGNINNISVSSCKSVNETAINGNLAAIAVYTAAAEGPDLVDEEAPKLMGVPIIDSENNYYSVP